MKFYSTNNRNHSLGFGAAVEKGLAADNGLYFPETIPILSSDFINDLHTFSKDEIGVEVMRHFTSEDISIEELKRIVRETLDFDFPLKEVSKDVFSLELFHGPTMAFKDVGARFMSRSLQAIAKRDSVVLVATSGDTGSAVANGFYKIPGIKVVLLYPSGKISQIQEMQLTTLGENITALQVDGVFDDCQALVKKAFLDEELNKKLVLTSANSINIARWLPQSIYYFLALAEARRQGFEEVVFSVPSGNLGNVTAGMVGAKMGLPVKKFIAATNMNKIVPDYLTSGVYSPVASVATISNAMDVGAPSNFVRLTEMYGNSHEGITHDLEGYYLNDDQTKKVMKRCYEENEYVLDPHGAIAYDALLKSGLTNDKTCGIFLETAHPAKFKDIVDDALDIDLPLPEKLKEIVNNKKTAVKMKNSYEDFEDFLRSNY
jgi:threonine synthase|tara:strand:+ start:6374 stop:7669 length:1296 start_codon:yes stop_codon:yes gene_type:complete